MKTVDICKRISLILDIIYALECLQQFVICETMSNDEESLSNMS